MTEVLLVTSIAALFAGAAGGVIASRHAPDQLVASIIVGVVGAFPVSYATWYMTGIPGAIFPGAVAGAVAALLLYRLAGGSGPPSRSRSEAKLESASGMITQKATPQGSTEAPLVRKRPLGDPAAQDRSSNQYARPPGVFISYRRQDTPHLAGRIYDRLGKHFGQERVFMDVDSIEPGLDFGEAIERAVSSSAVMLVLIGDKWLTATDPGGRQRLDNPDDYVRLEVEAALERGIRVIPVLVEGAAMPGMQELPGSLMKLARRNAFEISHGRFSADADQLISVIERIFAAPSR